MKKQRKAHENYSELGFTASADDRNGKLVLGFPFPAAMFELELRERPAGKASLQVNPKATDLGDITHGSLSSLCGLVVIQIDEGDLVQAPALHRLRESGEACIANVVAEQPQLLCMAHQTKRLSQKGVYANSQGMGTRQWGASTPSSGPGPSSHLDRE
jgi:hypothetical protein